MIHLILDNHDDIKLPSRVIVELRPKDMDSFMRVQSCAQNPLIRTVLPLQKRLSCLINFAMQKWQTQFALNVSFFNIKKTLFTFFVRFS